MCSPVWRTIIEGGTGFRFRKGTGFGRNHDTLALPRSIRTPDSVQGAARRLLSAPGSALYDPRSPFRT